MKTTTIRNVKLANCTDILASSFNSFLMFIVFIITIAVDALASVRYFVIYESLLKKETVFSFTFILRPADSNALMK